MLARDEPFAVVESVKAASEVYAPVSGEVVEVNEAMDLPAILDYREQAPSADSAAPTSDHFDPIFVVLGSAIAGERVRTLHEGFRYGSLSMRSFAVG